jgi:hypothetical protein
MSTEGQMKWHGVGQGEEDGGAEWGGEERSGEEGGGAGREGGEGAKILAGSQ